MIAARYLRTLLPRPVFGDTAIGIVLVTKNVKGGVWAWVDSYGEPVSRPTNSWFDAHPVFGGITASIIDGQHMVCVPKFYFKKLVLPSGTYAGKTAMYLSAIPFGGSHVHPAFMNIGSEISQFYYGKYQASVAVTGKMQSIASVAPAATLTIDQFRIAAAARNTAGVTGFMQHTFWQKSAIQILYLLEYGNGDSQTALGRGRVDSTSIAVVSDATVLTASYRGITGLWGNIYQFIDGIKSDPTRNILLWDKLGNSTWQRYSSNYYAGNAYIDDVNPVIEDGFILYSPSLGGETVATIPDPQYFLAVDGVGITGSYYNAGNSGGLFNLNLTVSPTGAYSAIGSRLAKI